MTRWLRIGLLGATVTSLFSACGGQDEGNPANVSGASSTGGRSSYGGASNTLYGGSSAQPYGGATTSSSGGRNSGGAQGTGASAGRPTLPGGGAPDDGVGGAPMEPPDKEPEVECPSTAPAEMSACDGRGHCSYVGVRCECAGGGADGRHWKCDGSGAACPATPPAAKSACENPKDGPALKCPYPDDSTCNCAGGTWSCMTPAKPGEPKPGEPKPGEPKPGEPKPGEPKPGEPKPGEPGPGAGGAPPGPPGPEMGGEGGDLATP